MPKGVGVRHRNLVNYSHFITQRLQLEKYPDGLHFATVSTLGADLGNTCIYPALISGGCLHVVPYEVSTDAQRFAALYGAASHRCAENRALALAGAAARSAEADSVLPRKYLITGGETLTPQLFEKIEELIPPASCSITTDPPKPRSARSPCG